jgi:NAD(P)-dependent dehydrogenase (short-subunit alcohol dehydrogenase family)
MEQTSGENVFGKVTRMEPERARRLVEWIGPALRALLGEGLRLKVVPFDDSELPLSLSGGSEGRATAGVGPLAPDQIVCAGAFPMWFEPPEGGGGAVFSPQRTQRAQRETAETWVQKRLQEEADGIIGTLRKSIATHARSTGFAPRVVVVKGLGIFSAGDDFQAAEIVRQTYLGAVRVMGLAKRLGGIHPMTEEQRRFIEGWEAEAYRKRTMAGTEAKGRTAGKVAVVTGAAQGFGLEISQDLAAEGAHVVLADVNVSGVEEAARRISERLGVGRAMGLAMDVTKSGSIAEAIHRVVRTYGGFDLVVSNAGVLRAGSVMTQPEAEFDFVTDVNYKGYFRCVQGCAPILATQHKARPSYWSDIIQINSKSGLVGSNRNGAYAGGKFGGIGLTQSFALELMEHGTKVNAVCPGNFFDGPLWSDPQNGLFVQYLRSGKIPGAKTIEDVRRAYEAMIPMGRGCTTADVMKAVYYLMEQQYETGQAVPVTGGQVMLR